MKSEVNSHVEDKKEIVYPCLMQSKQHIVLFTDENVGTCVWGTGNVWEDDIGWWSDEWDMEYFSPFKGSITLSND
jgi:hypothetical protein